MKIVLAMCVASCAALAAACAARGDPPLVVECRSSQGGERPGPALVGLEYGTRHTPIPLDSVQFDSSATAARIAVQSLFASRTPTDTVSVEARLVNCSDSPGVVRMRTSFLKDDRAAAEPTSAWRTVILRPRAIAHYQESSTSRGVAHYLIEIAGD